MNAGFGWLRSSPPSIVSLTHQEPREEKSMKPLCFSVHFQFRKIELISLLGATQTSTLRQWKSLQRPLKPISLKVTVRRLKAPPGKSEMAEQNESLETRAESLGRAGAFQHPTGILGRFLCSMQWQQWQVAIRWFHTTRLVGTLRMEELPNSTL